MGQLIKEHFKFLCLRLLLSYDHHGLTLSIKESSQMLHFLFVNKLALLEVPDDHRHALNELVSTPLEFESLVDLLAEVCEDHLSVFYSPFIV